MSNNQERGFTVWKQNLKEKFLIDLSRLKENLTVTITQKSRPMRTKKKFFESKAILKTSRRPSQILLNRINGFSELSWRLLSSRPSDF
uniref:Uncharacterized protein n=1 Tax=Phage sp. cty4N14 TaxID=2825799 RepID=A0A8S5U4X4_9VIRU|nr:MAG TPA: hypothetical protein [Phage sp. cty4N14]